MLLNSVLRSIGVKQAARTVSTKVTLAQLGRVSMHTHRGWERCRPRCTVCKRWCLSSHCAQFLHSCPCWWHWALELIVVELQNLQVVELTQGWGQLTRQLIVCEAPEGNEGRARGEGQWSVAMDSNTRLGACKHETGANMQGGLCGIADTACSQDTKTAHLAPARGNGAIQQIIIQKAA